MKTGINSSPVNRRKQTHQFKETARTDPYRSTCKPSGNLICPVCESVSIQGRWNGKKAKTKSSADLTITGEMKCPACRQLEDHFALGVIELHGDAWKKKKKWVMNTIANTEKIARLRNDQERVLWVDEIKDVSQVYVTLPELARQIGRELEKSFKGKVQYRRSSEEPFLRVRWYSDVL